MQSKPLIKGLIAKFEAIINEAERAHTDGQAASLISTYNSALDSLCRLFTEALSLNLSSYGSITSAGYLTAIGQSVISGIKIDAHSALAFLEELYIPISPETEEKLGRLRNQIEQIRKVLDDPAYAKNLDKALDELEKADDLASAMIASRVLDAVFNKIEDSETRKELDRLRTELKGKLDDFKKKQNIPKETGDILDRTYKNSRNYVNHDMHVFPEPADAYELLAGTIIVVDKLKELLNKT